MKTLSKSNLLPVMLLCMCIACAHHQELPRVKSNYYFQFKDGDLAKSELKSDGTRTITVRDDLLTDEENAAMQAKLREEWNGLKGWVAIPITDYNLLINRQNLCQ